MKTKLFVLYCFLFVCGMLAEASKSAGVHLRPTVCDIPEMDNTLTIDVSDNELWDSISVLSSRSLTVKDNKSLNYTVPTIIFVDNTVDSSAVYVRWRDGNPDTAKVYFHYPESFEPYFQVEKVVEGDECLREGAEVKQTVRVRTTCPTAFLMVGTGIDAPKSILEWEQRSISFSGADVNEMESNYYEVEMHDGDVFEYKENVLIKKINNFERFSTLSFGEIFVGGYSSHVFLVDMLYDNALGLCKDQTFHVNSCKEIEKAQRFYFFGPNVSSYELLTTDLPSGATVVMDERGTKRGYVDYTLHLTVDSRQTEYIHYKRNMKDGTVDYGVLTVELLPCITSVTVQKNDNEICNDDPCDYDGPSILINEVMVSPETNDGAIYTSDASAKTERGGEWLELYNPDVCHAVDISGYFFGNATSDTPAPNAAGTLDNLSAGFVLPEGTIVPPCGYCVLRGEFADDVDEGRRVENGGNVVVINLDEHLDRFCLDERGWRFWLPNNAGWFGFYNREGVPQDAVRWGTDDESTLSLDGQPCNAEIGEYAGSLPSYSEIQDSRKAYPFTKKVPNTAGMSLARKTDAGEWADVLIHPTLGYENTTPYHRADERCTGSITLNPHGGIGPFSYQWNDARMQKTPTATGLCEGTYCCEITDLGTGFSRVQCVTLETYSIDCPDCPQEIRTDTVEVEVNGDAYSHEGKIYSKSDVYCEHFYTPRGCDSVSCLKLTLIPVNENDPSACGDVKVILRDTVCSVDYYYKNGFEIDLSGERYGTKVYQYMGETTEGCDSLVMLYLVLEPCLEDDDKTEGQEPCDESQGVVPDLYFTPNADGVHDRWEIANIGCFGHKVVIFDRFGKELCAWSNNFDGWDGTYLGKPMPSTDYWYSIRLLPHGKIYTGHFTLAR